MVGSLVTAGRTGSKVLAHCKASDSEPLAVSKNVPWGGREDGYGWCVGWNQCVISSSYQLW